MSTRETHILHGLIEFTGYVNNFSDLSLKIFNHRKKVIYVCDVRMAGVTMHMLVRVRNLIT